MFSEKKTGRTEDSENEEKEAGWSDEKTGRHLSSLPTHLFVELTSLDELSFPTSSSARIRYTCLSASPHYLAVGSTSGTVYLFSRYAAKYRKSLSSVPVQVIACKEGAVQHVLSSPNEKYLAVATSRGHVSIVSLVGNYPSVLLNNTVHVGQAISCLCWISDSSRLYVGDTAGRISCSRVGNRNILRAASELVLELDSSIVQLDFAAYFLLISSMSRCYLYHITRYSCAQIGRKLRSGPYGACYFPSEDGERPIIFAGRPGGRLWEVDSDGVVYNTHQFNNLTLAPFAPLVTFRRGFDCWAQLPAKDTISFEKLHILSKEFILSVTGCSLCAVDPRKARIVVLCEMNEDVFILTCKEGALKKLSLFPLSAAVEKLHWRECFVQAAQVMVAYSPFLPNVPWKVNVIEDVILHLRNESREQNIVRDLLSVLERKKKETGPVSDSKMAKSSAVRLPTGVHRVLRVMENSGYEDDFTFRAPSPFTRKHRSLSLSNPTVTEIVPLSTDSKMVSSRSEDSLMQLLGRREEQNFNVIQEQEVLDSVEKMADALVNFSILPSTPASRSRMKTPTDISYPQDEYYSASSYWSKPKEPPSPPTPLKPMPEVPSVIQVQRSNRTKPLAVRRRKGQGRSWQAGSPSSTSSRGGSPSPSPQLVGDAEGDLVLHNYPPTTTTTTTTSYTATLKMNYRQSDYTRPSDRFSGSYFSPYDTWDDQVIDRHLDTDKHHCSKCGLHRSWLTVLRLGCYIGSIPVTNEEFLQGGVPSTLKDWVSMLNLRCSLDERSSISGKEKGLCHGCLSAFDLLRSRAMSEQTQQESVRIPVHPSDTRLKVVRYESAAVPELAYSTYYNPVYDSEEGSGSSPEEEKMTSCLEEGRRKWPWLRKAPLSGLLTAMAYVLGLNSVLETMREHRWLRKAGTDDVWLCLARLCGTSTDLALPHDILESVLCDSLGETESSRVLCSFPQTVHKPTAGTLVLDANQNCPCCTLPLVAKVSELSREIVAFSCGHAFHGICLKTRRVKPDDMEELDCMKCSYLAASLTAVV